MRSTPSSIVVLFRWLRLNYALFKIPATISVSFLFLKGLKQKRNGNFSTTTTFLFLFFKHDCWKGEFLLISVAFDVPMLDPCFNELQKFAFFEHFFSLTLAPKLHFFLAASLIISSVQL